VSCNELYSNELIYWLLGSIFLLLFAKSKNLDLLDIKTNNIFGYQLLFVKTKDNFAFHKNYFLAINSIEIVSKCFHGNTT